MKSESLLLIGYIILGIILGYVGFLLKDNILALVAAVVGFFAGTFILKFIVKDLKEKGYKWYFSNGGWIYFFIWFIVWVMFYNL